MADKYQGNDAQRTRLARLNDSYSVARWELEGQELHVWTDDGAEAMIHPDGTVTWGPETTPEQLPIIGRERALFDTFTKALTNAVGGPAPSNATMAQLRLHTASKPWHTHRGNAFEVQIVGPDGAPTGHIARVTVELDRFEEVRT